MSFNWEKKFKEKPGDELYKIYIGKTHHNSEAIEFARKELENRNVDFANIERHQKKWELEKLIQENEGSKFLFGNISSHNNYLVMTVTCALIVILTLFDIMLDAPVLGGNEGYRLDELLLFGFSLIFMIFGLIMFKKEKKKEQIRNKRIKELIEQL